MKNVELRTSLLLKHSELTSQLTLLEKKFSKDKEKEKELKAIKNEVKVLYEKIVEIPISQTLTIYELLYHRIHSLSEQVKTMRINKENELK